MAEFSDEFQKQFEAFGQAVKSEAWQRVIEIGGWLIANWSESKMGNEILSAVYNGRGNAYDELKQYDQAIDNFNKAIEFNPKNAKAYNNRGITYVKLKQYDRAIDDYDKAIELKPDLGNAFHNRALAFGKQKAEETEVKFTRSYNEQLRSITESVEIEKFFMGDDAQQVDIEFDGFWGFIKKVGKCILRRLAWCSHRQNSKPSLIPDSVERLSKLRGSAKRWHISLVIGTPLIWFSFVSPFDFFGFGELFPQIDGNNNGYIRITLASLATTFLVSPIYLFIRRINHDIRVERQALEDYHRKRIMLLLRLNPDEKIFSERTERIIDHFINNGTPEILNAIHNSKNAQTKKTDDDGDENRVDLVERVVEKILDKQEGRYLTPATLLEKLIEEIQNLKTPKKEKKKK